MAEEAAGGPRYWKITINPEECPRNAWSTCRAAGLAMLGFPGEAGESNVAVRNLKRVREGDWLIAYTPQEGSYTVGGVGRVTRGYLCEEGPFDHPWNGPVRRSVAVEWQVGHCSIEDLVREGRFRKGKIPRVLDEILPTEFECVRERVEAAPALPRLSETYAATAPMLPELPETCAVTAPALPEVPEIWAVTAPPEDTPLELLEVVTASPLTDEPAADEEPVRPFSEFRFELFAFEPDPETSPLDEDGPSPPVEVSPPLGHEETSRDCSTERPVFAFSESALPGWSASPQPILTGFEDLPPADHRVEAAPEDNCALEFLADAAYQADPLVMGRGSGQPRLPIELPAATPPGLIAQPETRSTGSAGAASVSTGPSFQTAPISLGDWDLKAHPNSAGREPSIIELSPDTQLLSGFDRSGKRAETLDFGLPTMGEPKARAATPAPPKSRAGVRVEPFSVRVGAIGWSGTFRREVESGRPCSLLLRGPQYAFLNMATPNTELRGLRLFALFAIGAVAAPGKEALRSGATFIFRGRRASGDYEVEVRPQRSPRIFTEPAEAGV